MSGSIATAATTERELANTLGRLRRVLRRRLRADWPYRPLLESEVELLRLVRVSPGLRVGDAAAALGVAPNTVSTLVRRLTEKGLLRRKTDERDARAAALDLTPAAVRRIAAWRDRRAKVLGSAIRRLDPADRQAIERAVPALSRLVDAVDES